MNFIPDYHNITDAAYNRVPKRLPLYEHGISESIMEKITGEKFAHLIVTVKDGKAYYNQNPAELDEYFSHFCNFYRQMGYDTVSYEASICAILPGGGALGGHKQGVISDRASFEAYPWDELPKLFFKAHTEPLKALRRNMPEGMKGIGGVGNGLFECVQDLVGYMDLCYIASDDPELYEELFARMGKVQEKIWTRFLKEFGDIFCVCRFGDDLGFKSATLLAEDDIRKYIIPQYAKIVDLVHSYQKPFLLHSCGCIFNVMDDIIEKAHINAKHSNEDQIARFPVWVEKYGDRIGNFGGIDTDVVCRGTPEEIRTYILDVINQCIGHGGFAFSSGNSIPDYVPVKGYLAMINTVREYRGDFDE